MKVDIIIPAYHGIYLYEAIDSCIKQTYKNFRITVVDNNSSINIKEICDKFYNINYIKSEYNLGPAGGRNLGIKNTFGDLISFLDDDDIMDNNKLHYSVEEFKKNSRVGMTCGNYRIIVNRKTIKPPFYKKSPIVNLETLMNKNLVATGSVTVRRELMKKVGGFDERFWICEDYDCWLKLSEITDIKYIKNVLYYYSVCPGNNSLTQRSDVQKNHLENIKIIKNESMQRMNSLKF